MPRETRKLRVLFFYPFSHDEVERPRRLEITISKSGGTLAEILQQAARLTNTKVSAINFITNLFFRNYWFEEMQRVYMQPTVTIFHHSPIHFVHATEFFRSSNFELPHFYSPRVVEGLNTEGVIRLEGLCNRTGNVCFVWHTRMTSIDLNF